MGFFRSLLKLKLYVGVFASGYLLHSCVSHDSRYRIKREDQKACLVDTVRHESLEIKTESFQVGSTEYRLRGLLQEPGLQSYLMNIKER